MLSSQCHRLAALLLSCVSFISPVSLTGCMGMRSISIRFSHRVFPREDSSALCKHPAHCAVVDEGSSWYVLLSMLTVVAGIRSVACAALRLRSLSSHCATTAGGGRVSRWMAPGTLCCSFVDSWR
jgi:hypothetical protein